MQELGVKTSFSFSDTYLFIFVNFIVFQKITLQKCCCTLVTFPVTEKTGTVHTSDWVTLMSTNKNAMSLNQFEVACHVNYGVRVLEMRTETAIEIEEVNDSLRYHKKFQKCFIDKNTIQSRIFTLTTAVNDAIECKFMKKISKAQICSQTSASASTT